MIIFYHLWLWVYKITIKYARSIEKLYFLDPVYLYKYSNLYYFPFYSKWFLVFFYERIYYDKIFYFVDNIKNIHAMRLHSYTKSHNFFSKKFLDELENDESKKKEDSIIKCVIGNEATRHNFDIHSFVNILLLEKIQYTLSWRELPTKKFIDRYLKSKNTFMLLNPKILNGFFSYFDKSVWNNYYRQMNKQNDFVNVIEKDFDIVYHTYIVDVKFYKFIDSIPKYTKFYEKLNRPKSKENTYFGDAFLKTLLYKQFELNEAFQAFYKTLYSVKYKPTDISQFLEKNKNVTSLFIRKNKIFNKGRYSRNRQLYRTGVYWCLWLNIINVFGLYYYFYRFVFNFGYFYLPMLLLILSIFGSRLVKYRFYNVTYVVNEVLLFIELFSKFMSEIIKNFLIRTKDLIIMLALYIYHTVLDFFQQK